MSLHSFQLDLTALKKDIEELGHRGPVMVARAVNRAAHHGQTMMVKEIARDTGLASKYIKREIKVDKANRTRAMAAIEIVGRRIPLIAFAARGPEPSRGRGRGVSYRLPSGRGRVKEAFIATVGVGGHRGVFKRRIPSRYKSVGAWSKNLPIVELRGPSLPHVFEKFIPVFERETQWIIAATLEHEISWEKARQAGPAEFPLEMA